MEELKIEIMGTPVKLEDGTEFISFVAFTKKGRMQLKFTKECNLVPTKSCFIYVNPEDKDAINVNRKGKFPVIWVSKVLRIEEFPDRSKSIEDLFDK